MRVGGRLTYGTFKTFNIWSGPDPGHSECLTATEQTKPLLCQAPDINLLAAASWRDWEVISLGAGGLVGKGLEWAEQILGHWYEEAWTSTIYRAVWDCFMTLTSLASTAPLPRLEEENQDPPFSVANPYGPL